MPHHQILIIGGGNAGISTAAQLLRKNSKLDIAIVDPADKHYYQPAWTLVGAGVFDIQKTERSEASVMPKGVTWIKQKALTFSPEENKVDLENGVVTYDYMIVCPGIQLNWNEIKGLKKPWVKTTFVAITPLKRRHTPLNVSNISKEVPPFSTTLLPR